MGSFKRFIFKVTNWGTALGAVFLVAVALLITTMVIFRAFNIGLPGTFDLAETMVIVVISFAMLYGQLNDSHIRADIAIERLTGRLRYSIEGFNAIVSIFYWAIILIASAWLMWRKLGVGEETDILKVPYAPFRMIWVFTLILMVILLIFKFIHQINVLIKGEEKK